MRDSCSRLYLFPSALPVSSSRDLSTRRKPSSSHRNPSRRYHCCNLRADIAPMQIYIDRAIHSLTKEELASTQTGARSLSLSLSLFLFCLSRIARPLLFFSCFSFACFLGFFCSFCRPAAISEKRICFLCQRKPFRPNETTFIHRTVLGERADGQKRTSHNAGDKDQNRI